MAGRYHEVHAGVEQVDHVTFDRDDPRRECHYLDVGPGRGMVKVVGGYGPAPSSSGWTGWVITAYPAMER